MGCFESPTLAERDPRDAHTRRHSHRSAASSRPGQHRPSLHRSTAHRQIRTFAARAVGYRSSGSASRRGGILPTRQPTRSAVLGRVRRPALITKRGQAALLSRRLPLCAGCGDDRMSGPRGKAYRAGRSSGRAERAAVRSEQVVPATEQPFLAEWRFPGPERSVPVTAASAVWVQAGPCARGRAGVGPGGCRCTCPLR